MKVLQLICGVMLVLGLSSCVDPGTNPQEQEDPQLVNACKVWRQGGGAEATGGGATGIVYAVTTLSDEPDENRQPVEGSLRYAVQRSGARIIVFRVAGVIHLTSPLEIRNGNLTVLGQSAPGDGICLADYPLVVKADNVIIRFIRCRMGEKGSLAKNTEYDALSVNDATNVLIDHCSFSWSVDECVSCYGNHGFTLQYCFITESLKSSVHGKGNHGYGGIWGGENATFHHNLLAHHDSRNPRFDHDYVNTLCGPIDYINNVVYNWGGNSTYGGEGSSNAGGGRKVNFINNYYKAGPATRSGVQYRLCNPTTRCSNCTDKLGGSVVPPLMWLQGNCMVGSAEVTADNWKGVHPDEAGKLDQCKASDRFVFANAYQAEETAEAAYETVLAKGGCSYRRDAVDSRIVEEVRQGTFTHKGTTSTGGLIDTPSDVGGWPEYSGTRAKDSDFDEIPDEWEIAHGLNPNLHSDGSQSTLVSGVMNLEVYLSDIVKDLY